MTVDIVNEVEQNIPVTNEETVTVEISIEGHSNLVLHAVPYNGTGCSKVNDIGLIIISWILLILKCRNRGWKSICPSPCRYWSSRSLS